MNERRYSGVYWKLYAAAEGSPRYISQRGGTRSGKTYSTLQFLNDIIPKLDKAGDITSVVSETLPHLKRGAIRDFERIVGHPLKNDPRWNASELVYTYDNGAKLEFFSADSPDRVLGPSRKRLFVNECNHIPYDTFVQLAVRTTKTIFLDYNPAAPFWATEEIEKRPNCAFIHSTYKDNEAFLSPEQVGEIESNKGNALWWKVYGEGEIGTLEGLVYSFEQIDAMPDPAGLIEVQGLDFGFTNDPTARVRILADTGRKIAYIQERCYRTRMLNSDIVADLKADGVSRTTEIYADCAEPKSIAEIGNAGYRIIPSDKDAPVKSDKRVYQIQWVKGWTLKVTKDSLNLIKELRNYTWAKDRDGRMLNVPIDGWDHLLDAMRYALFSKFGKRAGHGTYNISIGNVRHH